MTIAGHGPLTLALGDHWYIACPASNVGTEPRAFTCCGQVIRLMRDASGLRADRSDITLAEQDGYVWFWYGGNAPPRRPDAHPTIAVPGRWQRGTVGVDVGWSDFVENTLDLMHPMFAHPWTHPSWWLHRMGVRPIFETTVKMTATGWTAEASLELPRDWRWRFMWQEFRLPDRVRLVALPPPGSPGEAGMAAGATEVTAYHTPETAERTRIEFLMGRRALPWERKGIIERPGGMWLHRQDKAILEGLARNRRDFPDWREANVPPDAYTLLFRKIVAEVAAGRWATTWQSFPAEITLRARI